MESVDASIIEARSTHLEGALEGLGPIYRGPVLWILLEEIHRDAWKIPIPIHLLPAILMRGPAC